MPTEYSIMLGDTEVERATTPDGISRIVGHLSAALEGAENRQIIDVIEVRSWQWIPEMSNAKLIDEFEAIQETLRLGYDGCFPEWVLEQASDNGAQISREYLARTGESITDRS